MSNGMECRKCRYWFAPQTEEGKDLGECHRRSPRAGKEAWPMSAANNFCGEYAPRDRKTTSTPITMR